MHEPRQLGVNSSESVGERATAGRYRLCERMYGDGCERITRVDIGPDRLGKRIARGFPGVIYVRANIGICSIVRIHTAGDDEQMLQ